MKTIVLPFSIKKPILACGADLKGAFAIAKGRAAYLFDGFGDLGDADNLARYEKAIAVAEKRLKIKPAVVACDMHPEYRSSIFAERYAPVRVQHHEAHIAAAMADAGMSGKVIGVAFDGTGYGPDGNIWGGEFFVGDMKKMTRVAHLEYVHMPGGEACVHEPWRMAASYLYKAYGADLLKLKIGLVRNIDAAKWRILKQMIENNVNSPLTSSAGRLFDAAASIILDRRGADFEAELPIELEKTADKDIIERYEFDIVKDRGMLIIKCGMIFRGMVKDMERKVDRSEISSKFHNTVADIITKTVAMLRKKYGISDVVYSGGVFQNRYLADRIGLVSAGVPVNDGGIPIGQVAIANARVK